MDQFREVLPEFPWIQGSKVREARQQISRLLDAVGAGEEIVIMRHGKPAACLLPFLELETGEMRFPDRSTLRAMLPSSKLPAV